MFQEISELLSHVFKYLPECFIRKCIFIPNISKWLTQRVKWTGCASTSRQLITNATETVSDIPCFCVFFRTKPKTFSKHNIVQSPLVGLWKQTDGRKTIRACVFGRVLGRTEGSYLLFRLRLITVTAGQKSDKAILESQPTSQQMMDVMITMYFQRSTREWGPRANCVWHVTAVCSVIYCAMGSLSRVHYVDVNAIYCGVATHFILLHRH